jgi:hypothetical protein
MLLLITLVVLILATTHANIHDSWQRNLNELSKAVNDSPSASDYDSYSFKSTATGNNLHTEHYRGRYKSTNREYSGWFASFNPSYFSFFPAADDGCTRLEDTKTMSTAEWHETCEYATNGAFFSMNGPNDQGSYCIGNLISQGKIIQLPNKDATPAQIGITNNNEVILGMLNENTLTKLKFHDIISGNGWLVRNGMSYVNTTTDIGQPAINHTFVTEKAPRTAVGILKKGANVDGDDYIMALLQVDGVEDLNLGPDLFEFAELAVELGFESLINIDGGGSSVSIHNGEVISRPTCDDTGRVCERRDANIACVKKSK